MVPHLAAKVLWFHIDPEPYQVVQYYERTRGKRKGDKKGKKGKKGTKDEAQESAKEPLQEPQAVESQASETV